MNYRTEDVTVERDSDDIGSWSVVRLLVCSGCGAYIYDTVTHDDWHRDRNARADLLAELADRLDNHGHMTSGKIG